MPVVFLTAFGQNSNNNSGDKKSKTSSKELLNNVKSPIYYEADKQSGTLDGFSVLEGKVKIIQDDMSIRAEKAELYWKTNPNEPDKIILIDKVIFNNQETKGYCSHGVFYNAEKKFVMTGDPVLYRKKSQVRATEIIYYVDTKKFELKKPRSLVIPDPTDKAAQNKSKKNNNPKSKKKSQ